MKSHFFRMGSVLSVLPFLIFSKSVFAEEYIENVSSVVLSQQDRSDAIFLLILFAFLSFSVRYCFILFCLFHFLSIQYLAYWIYRSLVSKVLVTLKIIPSLMK